ncbi:PIR Superfamily Protein [Plasmodium ovale wallikeri]|uniref:PIR Superfamily Protein n=1 Tax=Plasmodium ovale wallikeri TaxID=864142 RepID=A0A1A9AK15_PLAOA|nr:PIR Superfamily Protein [Plasmodium ovale wallikeri]
MASSGENEWEDLLSDLPSYEKYKSFDETKGIDDIVDCESLENEERVHTFCKMMVRNLRELATIGDNHNRQERCYYLQHWIYYKIRKMFVTDSNYNQNMGVVNKIMEVAKKINYSLLNRIPCGVLFYNDITTWKEEKDLHDYFKSFEYINCNISDKEKCQKYKEYVTYIKELYETYKPDDCCPYGESYNECPHYFNCEEIYNPSDLLPKLINLNTGSDINKGELLKGYKDQHQQGDRLSPLLTVGEAENRKSFQSPNNMPPFAGSTELPKCQGSLLENMSQPCVNMALISQDLSARETATRLSPSSVDNASQDISGNIFSTPVVTSDALSESNNDSSNIIITVYNVLKSNNIYRRLVIVSVLGACLFLFYYFRLRPSASIPYKKNKKNKKKKKINNYHRKQHENQLPFYELESVYIESPMRQMHLTYNPAQYTLF